MAFMQLIDIHVLHVFYKTLCSEWYWVLKIIWHKEWIVFVRICSVNTMWFLHNMMKILKMLTMNTSYYKGKIWCLCSELTAGLCSTFVIAVMCTVPILDYPGLFKTRHKKLYEYMYSYILQLILGTCHHVSLYFFIVVITTLYSFTSPS